MFGTIGKLKKRVDYIPIPRVVVYPGLPVNQAAELNVAIMYYQIQNAILINRSFIAYINVSGLPNHFNPREQISCAPWHRRLREYHSLRYKIVYACNSQMAKP